MKPYYLKWTEKGRIPSHRGGAKIPYRKWTTQVSDPVLCERGWHACRWEDAVDHISAELWVVELDGRIIEGVNKVVGERLRIVRKVSTINDRTLRLFAADCAESVLHLFEERHPDDDRPRLAIQAARDYANGLIDSAASWAASLAAELAASCSVVASAAYSAAYSAADSATDSAAALAAYSAAGSADRSAARSADSAAWSAAQSAQVENLLINYAGLDPADFAHRGTP